MFHKFHSQINILFLADSLKKSTKGACQVAKAVKMGVKIGLADSNIYLYHRLSLQGVDITKSIVNKVDIKIANVAACFTSESAVSSIGK